MAILQFGDILVSMGIVIGCIKYVRKPSETMRLIGLTIALVLLLAAIYL